MVISNCRSCVTLLVLLIGAGGKAGGMTPGRVQRTLAGRRAQLLHGGNASGAGGETFGAAHTGRLHSQSLAHDGAAASQDLEVGHGTSTGAGASSGRESTQGSGSGALEEGAHSPGLLKHCLHGDENWDPSKTIVIVGEV
jgi:hypothetical protein